MSFNSPPLPHPLVVDETTKLCRYATQDDIHWFEAICSAYKAMVEESRERVAAADALAKRLDYRRTK